MVVAGVTSLRAPRSSGRFLTRICNRVATRSRRSMAPDSERVTPQVRWQPRAVTAGNGRIVSAKTRLAVVGTALLAGCYTLQPSRGATPQPGKIIGLDINDAGRVALSGSMGPEIGQIEGRLVSRDSAEYVVGVTTLHL